MRAIQIEFFTAGVLCRYVIEYSTRVQGRIYSQQGPVQKKCGGPSTGVADPIFPGKNWRPFLVITVRVIGSPQKLATFFCSLLSFHSAVAHFSGMQKICRSFCGGPFLWGPCLAEHAEHA